MARNQCGQSGYGTLKLTVSQEWIDGKNLFFVYWYKFMQIKSWLKMLKVDIVKIGVASPVTRL